MMTCVVKLTTWTDVSFQFLPTIISLTQPNMDGSDFEIPDEKSNNKKTQSHYYMHQILISDSSEAPNSPDFRFSDGWRKNYHWVEDGFSGYNEMEPQLVLQADDYSAYSSPPAWEKTSTTTRSTDVRPLLPNGHPCSDLSPRSLIANSREEMMKMIRDLPESSYELSLKDIVDIKIAQQDAKLKPPTEEEEPGGLLLVKHDQVKEKKKMTWSDSMDNSAFLIKTFFTSFSLSKRKLELGNTPRTIPMSSSSGLGFETPKANKYCEDKLVKATAGNTIDSRNKYRPEEDEKEGIGCLPSMSGRKNRTRKIIGYLF